MDERAGREFCDAERCSIMEKFDEQGGTINGHPAIIGGRLLPFPFVMAMDGSALRVEFAWGTLRRAVDSGRVHLKA